MGDAAEQESAYGDVAHGFGHVETLVVVANETAPSDPPSRRCAPPPTGVWEDVKPFGPERLTAANLRDSMMLAEVVDAVPPIQQS